MRPPKSYSLWQQCIAVLTLVSVTVTGLFSTLPAQTAYAENETEKHDLAVILVEESLLNDGKDIKSRIERYAEDIRKNLNDTKVLILSVDNKSAPLEIRDVLERMYFHGDNNNGKEQSQLKGVILIGNIPRPEVYISEGFSLPTLAPYTDFEDKAIIYEPKENRFQVDHNNFKPEVWHGVMRFDTKEALIKYLDENHRYYSGEKKLKRSVWYTDLIAEAKALNESQYELYQNTLKYAEDIAYKRFTGKFMSSLMGGFRNSVFKEPSAVDQQLQNLKKEKKQAEGACLWGMVPNPKSLIKQETSVAPENKVPDIYSVFPIEQYLPEYGNVVQSYIRKVQDNINASGRWNSQDSDYFAKQITLKDIEMRGKLKNANERMKKALTEYIENEWQVEVSVPVEIKENGVNVRYYPNYVYGIPASQIKTVYDCTWLRGTPGGQDAVSQLIEMNRTYDVNALSCNGYGGCCLQNATKSGACNPNAASNSVISIYGSIANSQAQLSPSYKNCLTENWKGFTGDRKSTTLELITKKISSTFVHDEPRSETLSKQIEAKFVRNLPVDAIPYIDFQDKDLSYRRIDFPNFFKSPTSSAESFIKATTQDIQNAQSKILSYQNEERKKVLEALKNLKELRDSYSPEQGKESKASIENKIAELEWRLSTLEMQAIPDGFFEQLFTKEELKEIDIWLAWKNFNVTQKYHFLSLINLFQAPKNSQKNELSYLRGKVIDGNLLLEFDHNKSASEDLMYQMWLDQKSNEETAARNMGTSPGGRPLEEKCGSYEGVEIWEWPGAVMCWLEDLKNFKIIETKSFEQAWKNSWGDFQREVKGFKEQMQSFSEEIQQEPIPERKISAVDSPNNSKSNTSVGAFSHTPPISNESLSDLRTPERFSLLISKAEQDPFIFTLPIRLYTNSQKLFGGFREVDISLPKEIQSNALDINSQKEGLQIAVIDGKIDLPLFTTKSFAERTISVKVDSFQKQLKVASIANIQAAINIENIQSDPETGMSVALLNVHFSPEFYGDIPVFFAGDSRVHFMKPSAIVQNGYLEMPVVFQTSRKEIPFTLSSPYFESQTFQLPSRSQVPSKFLTSDEEYYVQAGKKFPLEIQVVDDFLEPVEEDVIFQLYVTPVSNNYTSLQSQNVVAKKGKITVDIGTFAKHGDIHIALMKQGMQSKLITVKSRTKIRPDDISEMSSAFTFFAQEVSANADTLIQKMLNSGSIAVAQKAPKPREEIAKLEILPLGNFILRDADIQVEHQGGFQFSAYKTSTLERYVTWKLQFQKNPKIVFGKQEGNIQIESGISTGLNFENEVLSYEGKSLARIDHNGINILDNRFQSRIISDEKKLSMHIVYGQIPVAIIHFYPQGNEIVEQSLLMKKAGERLLLKNPGIDQSLTHTDAIGWQGDNKSILEAAARMPWGQAFMDQQSITDVFWGDPVMSYTLEEQDLTLSKYDTSIGKLLYRGDESLKVFRSFDYNKDGIPDLIVQEGDQHLVLLEGSETGKLIIRGKYGMAGEGITQIETGDFLGDSYDDILVATKGGKVYFFNNEQGHISPETTAFITDAREITSMAVADFDKDKLKDIALSTSRGEIVVHYGNSQGFESKAKIIKSAGITLNHENAGKDILSSVPAQSNELRVYRNREAFSIAGFQDVNKDNIKDLLLIKLSATESKTAEGYTLISSSNPSPIVAIGTSQGTFRIEKDTINDSSGNALRSSKVRLPDFISISIPRESGAEILKLPIQNVSGAQKYYSSLDRNSIDLYSLVDIDISLPKGSFQNGAYIVDTLPPFLEFVADSVSCNQENCKAFVSQGAEPRVVFGPFSNKDSLHIQYQTLVRNTARFSFEYKKDLSALDIPELKKRYISDKRTWREYDIPLEKNVNIIEDPKKSSESEISEALKSSWGLARDNTAKTDTILGLEDTLQKGIDFLENLNCINGNCINLPVNKAFLVPGTWSIAPTLIDTAKGTGVIEGLAQGLNNNLERVGIPLGPNPSPTPFFGIKNCVGPIPIQPCWGQTCYQDVATACIPTPSPTDFRMYLSPTITGGLGMAMCTGPAMLSSMLSTLPSIPQCMAFALPVDRVVGACQSLNTSIENLYNQAKTVISSGGTKKTTLFQMDGAITQGDQGKIDGYAGFTIDIETIDRLFSSERLQNKSTYPFPASLFIRWWDAQKSQFAKLLSLPSITFYYPQMDAVLAGGADDQGLKIDDKNSEWGKLQTALNNFTWTKKENENTSNQSPTITNKQEADGITGIKQAREGVNFLDEEIITPASNNIESLQNYVQKQQEGIEEGFQNIFDVVENIPFVSLERKPVDILIPWINPQELNSIIGELELWLNTNEKEINRFIAALEKIQEQCKNWDLKTSDELPIGLSAEVCKKAVNLTLPIDLRALLTSIHKNLELLKQYRDYPQTLAKYKSQLAYYLMDALRYVNALIDVLGGWIERNKAIADKYVHLYRTLKEVVNAWEMISLAFSDYQTNCDSCRADVYSQNFSLYNIIFGFIPSPPIVVFPRWPDVILDFSHIEAGIKIVIPELRFHTKEVNFEFDLQPIKLPDLDFMVDLNFGISIPPLPLLPELPPLPDLPQFPNLPLPQLPDLPPPPKLPKLLDCISQWADVIKLLLRMYCLVTNGLWVYPESQLTQVIEALTNRSSAFMLPSDFLQLQWPDISYPWIDSINVDGYLNIEPKVDTIQKPVENIAEKINNISTDLANSVQRAINDQLNAVSGAINRSVKPINDTSRDIDTKGEKALDDLQDKLNETERSINKSLMNAIPESSIQVPSLKNYYVLAETLKTAIQEEMKDAKLLASSNHIQAVPVDSSATVLAANSVQSSAITLETEYQKSLQEIKKVNNQTEKILQGLFVYNQESNTQESVMNNIEQARTLKSPQFIDIDDDGDEDILYTENDEFFLKKSYAVEAAKEMRTLYPQKARIDTLRSHIPLKRSVNNFHVFSGNGEATFSWKDEEAHMGYILQKIPLVYGFDQYADVSSEYVFLLKNPIFEKEENFLGKTSVKIAKTSYPLQKGERAKILHFEEAQFIWSMPNDFYYARIYALDTQGKVSVTSEQRLVNPQKALDTASPTLLEQSNSKVPVLKEWPISPGVFEDSSTIRFKWDLDRNGTVDYIGENYSLPAQDILGKKVFDVIAEDSAGNRSIVQKNVEIYAPGIKLQEASSQKISGSIEGNIPLMPFAFLRKRGENYKLITPKNGKRFYSDTQGNFDILKSSKNAGISIQDEKGKTLATVSESGAIKLSDSRLQIQAEASNANMPLQVVILNQKQELVARISYISSTSKIQVVENQENLKGGNSTRVLDMNVKDTLKLIPIPDSAVYFKNGIALAGEDKTVYAAISSNGAIRILDNRLKIGIAENKDEMIFGIYNSKKEALALVNLGEQALTTSSFPHQKDTSFLERFIQWISQAVSADEAIRTEMIAEEKEKKTLSIPFTDLNPEHPYYQSIKDLYERNILKGYDDGSYRPNTQISRAEFVKIALGATTCFDCASPTDETKEEFVAQKPFPDVNLVDWFYYCISIAKKEKMVTGYGDGQFHPNKNISRKEAVAVLLRQIGAELEEMPEGSFSDVPEYDWAKNYVYTAVQMGLIKNQGGFIFPNEEITRGEFAMMASRILEIRDCKIRPEYQDTRDVIVGKKPGENTKTPTKDILIPQEDGTTIIKKPDGTSIRVDQNGNIIKDQKEPSKETIQDFGGVCLEFKNGLCPILPENFEKTPEILVETPYQSMYPPLTFPKASDIQCIFTDTLEDFLPGDRVSAIIIAPDNKRIFSRSNEITIQK